MSTDNVACKACGCGLEHSDVRQLAVYYRSEHPSVVAVQYVCPRCGSAEWQRYDADEWPHPPAEQFEPAIPAEHLELPADDSFVANPRSLISLDEYIDFGVRLARLSREDLMELRGG
jgi:hypothetical protein